MTTLRFLFILLLALNALAFAAIQGWLGTSAPQGERERISNQLNPERVQLIGADKPTPAAPAVAAPARVPAEPSTAPAPVEAATQAEVAPTPQPEPEPTAQAAELPSERETAPAAEADAEPTAATQPAPAEPTAARPAGICVAWARLASGESR